MLLCIQWNCLHPYNTIWLFHHILVLHNHTKTHTWLFYLILILINLLIKLRSMITWFWHQIVSFSFCCDKFNIFMFSPVFHGFSKNYIFINLKKYFSKSYFAFFLRSLFISVYDFNQAFCLNLLILCNFFRTDPWFNPCFKSLMCITYSVLSCKLATRFWFFQFSFFLAKSVNH